MDRRDKESRKRDDSPVHKKKKKQSEKTHKQSIATRDSNDAGGSDSDGIEVLYEKLKSHTSSVPEAQHGQTKEKEITPEKKCSEGIEVERLTQLLEEATLRENELRKELTQTKEREENVKKERDRLHRLFEKCCIETRSYQLRAEYAERIIDQMETKCVNDPELRQENIRLHKKVGDLCKEVVQLQKELAELNIQVEKTKEAPKQLTEEGNELPMEKEKIMRSDENEEKEKETRNSGEKECGKKCDEKKKRELSGRRSEEREDDYDDVKREVKRLRKERDEWRDEAEYHKNKNIKITKDIATYEDDIGWMQNEKEKWRDKYEDEKKRSGELESKLKKAQSEKREKCKDGEEMTSSKVSNDMDEKLNKLLKEKEKWMEKWDEENKKNIKLESKIKEIQDMNRDEENLKYKSESANMHVTSDRVCQTDPLCCEECKRLRQVIREYDEEFRKAQDEKVRTNIEMANLQKRVIAQDTYYPHTMNPQHFQQPPQPHLLPMHPPIPPLMFHPHQGNGPPQRRYDDNYSPFNPNLGPWRQ